ncbi:MAG: PilZ domain-containing protein [Proteobacteria bacterium]|nr:PilZ domain-containing protein [Pseudomonadota bacterium]MCP4920546.1 PilZ domain-containing protein [Pseudomonadota bacterium]
MFEGILGNAARKRRPRRSPQLGGHELLEHAALTGERGVMVLGEPLQVAPVVLRDLAEHKLIVLAPGLDYTPVAGHLVLVRIMVLGRSVACHARVLSTTPNQAGIVLRLELVEQFLVVQARRAFRIPARGLEIGFEIVELGQNILLHDVSLQGAGVVVEGQPLATASVVPVLLTHGEVSLHLPAQVVGVHGDVTGLLFQPNDAQVTSLRRLIMHIERAWIARERRVR